jgi:ABC-type cobalamin/Fe3+-siderophores transport system ATPase subunit
MPLMEFAEFDRRPILVAIAGPNGAGNTTFFHAHLALSGLRFVNADVLASELAVEPYEAARLADALRRTPGLDRAWADFHVRGIPDYTVVDRSGKIVADGDSTGRDMGKLKAKILEAMGH